MDISRLITFSPGIITTYFTKVDELYARYLIDTEDIWNIDEKGFKIGYTSGEAVIINKL
jgi:hypothetical protein